MSDKPLGRLHHYWLREIAKSSTGKLAIGDYSGTPHGAALQGLYKRKLIAIEIAFEGMLNLTVLTDAGRAAMKDAAVKAAKAAPKE